MNIINNTCKRLFKKDLPFEALLNTLKEAIIKFCKLLDIKDIDIERVIHAKTFMYSDIKKFKDMKIRWSCVQLQFGQASILYYGFDGRPIYD